MTRTPTSTGRPMRSSFDEPLTSTGEFSRTQILCTLGPSSLDDRTIRRLEQAGANLFRINLSHTRVDDLSDIVRLIKKTTDVPICLDTEGAQVRTGDMFGRPITLRDNTIVDVHFTRVPADDKNLNFYPLESAQLLDVGDFVSIDFNSVLTQVIARSDDRVSMRVLQGGLVGQSKAITIERDVHLSPLTDKDRAAIEVGLDMGLTHFALSFANRGEDVEAIRALVGDESYVISKIESTLGMTNIEAIADRSDALLIDRGDLSRQVPIELLPQAQKGIIARAKASNKPVFVATNLLESMVSVRAPTRAEVNDIYNTLLDGADGLVLAAETAIGKYPIECASMVSKIIRGFSLEAVDDVAGYYPEEAVSLLVAPHGGRLVHREAGPGDVDDLSALPSLAVERTDLMDCEQVGYGTYSPLTGFMNQEQLTSVLANYRLPDGEVWTLPILLQLGRDHDFSFSVGDRIVLTDDLGVPHALLDVSQIYTYDLERLAAQMYGTTAIRHPGVARLMAKSDTFIAGDVTLVKPLESPHRHYLLTPAQTRFIFTRLGWSQVVGFHTRNAAHRAHEWIQAEALERSGADGLYINPVARPEKPGDFLPEAILLSYRTLLEFGCYPEGRAVLGSFFTYSRYAGPREAVFTALCRQNMGCSHFIVGRDHTGVGDFYSPDANRWLFDAVGDIGITPIFFDPVGYNEQARRYEIDVGQGLSHISGTQVRDTLRQGRALPDWFMRELVQEALRAELKRGRPVFNDDETSWSELEVGQ